MRHCRFAYSIADSIAADEVTYNDSRSAAKSQTAVINSVKVSSSNEYADESEPSDLPKPENANSTLESYYNGQYLFKTTFDNPAFELPLREKPNVNSREIYVCPKNSVVFVIESIDVIFVKAYVNGFTGYLTRGLLKRKK